MPDPAASRKQTSFGPAAVQLPDSLLLAWKDTLVAAMDERGVVRPSIEQCVAEMVEMLSVLPLRNRENTDLKYKCSSVILIL